MIPHEAWPVDPAAVIPFLIAITLVEITPGPNMAYLAALTAAQGRHAGVRAVMGVTLGLAIYMLAAVAGVAQAIAAAPSLYQLLRAAGIAYLLWIAWTMWRGEGQGAPPPPPSDMRPFWRGLIANLLNPKVAVFYVTLLPGFIAADHGSFARQALILGGLHLSVSVVVHLGIVLAAARAAGYAPGSGASLRRVAAIVVALVAMWLLWETRR